MFRSVVNTTAHRRVRKLRRVGTTRARKRKIRPRDSAYTLTEMLVVLIIIGLIAAAVTPAVIGQLDRARVRTARLQLDTVSAALEMYRGDLQRYPTSEE